MLVFRNCFVILMKTQKQNITLNGLNNTFPFYLFSFLLIISDLFPPLPCHYSHFHYTNFTFE